MFATASRAAARVAQLTWFMIIVSAVIFGVVIVIMAITMARRRGHRDDQPDLVERGDQWLLWGGAVIPVVVLVAVVVYAVRVMRENDQNSTPAGTVLVTGHQWWWQLDYDLGGTVARFRTANELHVPVGRPVRLRLTTADVIHSFWVPSLRGKMDLLPGDTNEMSFEADRAGTYSGACAEYCGAQHAHMAITVVAQDSASFAAWARHQAEQSAPVDSSMAEGERLFVGGVCSSCHTVRGTTASGTIGPDLTHVAARATIAAGSLPTSLGNFEGWIANPQGVKPGTLMPRVAEFGGPELQAIAKYLSGLK